MGHLYNPLANKSRKFATPLCGSDHDPKTRSGLRTPFRARIPISFSVSQSEPTDGGGQYKAPCRILARTLPNVALLPEVAQQYRKPAPRTFAAPGAHFQPLQIEARKALPNQGSESDPEIRLAFRTLFKARLPTPETSIEYMAQCLAPGKQKGASPGTCKRTLRGWSVAAQLR